MLKIKRSFYLLCFALLLALIIKKYCSYDSKFIHIRKSHVILWTHPRSGSTFTAMMLSMMNNTFYSEDPYRHSHSEDKSNPVAFLKDILLCQFSKRKKYYLQRLEAFAFDTNEQSRELCFFDLMFNPMCFEPMVDEIMCGKAQIHFVKLNILDLSYAFPLLLDKELNVTIIHLVRDPRGIFPSRHKMENVLKEFKDPYLSDEKFVCSNLNKENDISLHLSKIFKQRFIRMRYEDLALNAMPIVQKLYNHFGVPMDIYTFAKIQKHTLGISSAINHNQLFNVLRNSSEMAFKWRETISFSVVERIQQKCEMVITKYGFRLFKTKEEYKNGSVNVITNTWDTPI